MIRQADIPSVRPGEPLSASLLNQVIGGANTARTVSGDDSIDPSIIGGMMTLKVNFPRGKDRGVLVQIVYTRGLDSKELPLPGAVYVGKLYQQILISVPDPKPVAGTRASTKTVNPSFLSCYVLNAEEFDESTHLINRNRTVIGRIVGVFRGKPLIGVNVQLGSGHFTVIVKKTTGSAGSKTTACTWAYDLYAPYDTDLSSPTKLNNAGSLQPKCSRARILNVPVTAATDGTVGSAYYDASGIIQLFDCQEFAGQINCS